MPSVPDSSAQAERTLLIVAIILLSGLLFSGLASYWSSYGYALTIGVPLTMGCAFGYGVRLKRKGQIALGLVLVAVLVVSILALGWAGTVCLGVFLVIVGVPATVGIAIGVFLRRRLDRRSLGRDALGVLLLLALPVPGLYAESLSRPQYTEAIHTSRVIGAPPHRVWDALVFYEQIPQRRSLAALIGLPRPLYTIGEIGAVGDRKRCVYSSGHLVKLITEYLPGRLLRFDVVEQVGVEDRSIELLDGSFELAPLPNGTTRLTLTTRYRPLLQARPLWRPFERYFGTELHEHVLDAMQTTSEGAFPLLVRRNDREER